MPRRPLPPPSLCTAGGCGASWPVTQTLDGPPPSVFTLQLVWESHEEEPGPIAATMRAVGEEVRCCLTVLGVLRCRMTLPVMAPQAAPRPPVLSRSLTLIHSHPAPPSSQVDLGQLYRGPPPGASVYRLRSMVSC